MRYNHYDWSVLFSWLGRNVWFFALWLVTLAAVAFFAHQFATNQWIFRFIGREAKVKHTFGYFVETWGTCSKCVSYWIGGLASAIIHCIYWQSLIGLYFMPIGAAWAAIIAVSIYLY